MSHCLFPEVIRNPRPNARNPTEFIQIPCGKCFGCLQRKRDEWVTRMELEQQKYPISKTWFVTLTYADEFLPIDGVDKETCQAFLKALKENRYEKMKYFFISEYGPTTFRPHYHAILFNTSADHRKIIEDIEDFWFRGSIEVTESNSDRLGYCAGYEISRSEVPEGLNANFRLISKGIGYQEQGLEWISRLHKTSIHRNDGRLQPIPRYILNKVCDDKERHYLSNKKKEIAEQMFKKDSRTLEQLTTLQEWDKQKLERAKKKPKCI